jgi:ferredoxin--NADP+ reductase
MLRYCQHLPYRQSSEIHGQQDHLCGRSPQFIPVLLAGKLRKVADKMFYITRDGTQGMRGHINNLGTIIAGIDGGVDRVILNGCNYVMMRGCEETRPLGIKTIVSLNTLMIDGTGMCGVCRVTVNGSNKFACVDGPHFDGHEVNWDELSNRRQAYLREETITLRTSAPEK